MGLLAATLGLAGGGPGRTQPSPEAAGARPTVEAARAGCRTLTGEGAGDRAAAPYSGTRLHPVYWRYRDGYRVPGERDAPVVLRLAKTTWGGGQSATVALKDAGGRWRAAHLADGAVRPTRYNVWRTGALAPEQGAELDALLADACLLREPASVLGNVIGVDGPVSGKCGALTSPSTYTLEVTTGGQTRMYTRACELGLAGALAGRLDRPQLAAPEAEERF